MTKNTDVTISGDDVVITISETIHEGIEKVPAGESGEIGENVSVKLTLEKHTSVQQLNDNMVYESAQNEFEEERQRVLELHESFDYY